MSQGWLETLLCTRIGRDVTALVIGRLTRADCMLVYAAGLPDYADFIRNMATYISTECAQYGHLPLLRWLAKIPGIALSPMVAEIAALYGQLHVLKWHPPLSNNMKVYINAAKGGHVHVLEWLTPEPEWFSTIAAVAAYNGRIMVLAWLQKQDYAFTTVTCAEAAAGGQLGIIQWLFVQGYPWDTDTTYSAIRTGNLDVLKWVIENGCPCTSFNACLQAIEYNQIGVVQWLYTRGFPITVMCFRVAAYFGQLPILQWLYTVEPLTMHREWQSCLHEAHSTGSDAIVEWLQTIKSP